MSIPAKFTVALLPGFLGLFVASILGYQSYLAENEVIALKSSPSTSQVLGDTDEILTFRVNAPTRFTNTVKFDLGLNLGDSEINTQGNASFGSVSAETVTASNLLYSISTGTGTSPGLSIDDTDPQNPIITNTGILTLVAGDYIKVEGNKISSTYTFTPDYTQGGWKRTGSILSPYVLSDSVEVGALTASSLIVNGITVLDGNVTVGNGVSILPNTDLGSDLGSSTYRFNNLWVANINSNSSQSFAGQTTFSYPPQDDTISQASVLINPTTSAANGQLLGLGVAGYQRALIDEKGNLTLGYNDQTSAPASDYPLNIYGHSGTRVSFVTNTGNAYFAGNVGVGTSNPASKLHVAGSSWPFVVTGTGFVGVGTTNPTAILQVATTAKFDSNLFVNGDIYNQNGIGGKLTFTNDGPIFQSHTAPKVTLRLKAVASQTADILQWIDSSNNVLGVINSSGNVGIGTTSPDAKLTLHGSLKLRHPSQPGWAGWDIEQDSSANMRIGYPTNAPNALYIKFDTGNVGIGTTAPTAKLTINGTTADNTASALSVSNSSSTSLLFVRNDGNVGIGTTNPITKAEVIGGHLTVATGENSGEGRIYFAKGTYGSGGTWPQYIRGNAGNWYFTGLAGEEMSLDLNSSEGGISTYQGDFNLNAGAASKGIEFRTQGNTHMYLNSSGNLGIGTTTPGANLEIAKTDNISPFLKLNGAGNTGTFPYIDFAADRATEGHVTGGLRFYNMGANPINGIYSYRGTTDLKGQLVIYTSNVEALRINESGNIGIGTTAPGEKLEVAGNIKTSSLTTGTVYSNAGVLTNTDPSDQALKANVLDLSKDTLHKLMRLRAVSFNWKSTGDGALGFIAQEVRDVFPELVGTNSDGSLGLYTTQFIPVLTRAIQEQQLQINSLQGTLQGLPAVEGDSSQEASQSATVAYATTQDVSLLQSLIDTIQQAIASLTTRLDALADQLFTKKIRTEELCIGTSSEDELCLSRDQVQQILDTLPSPTPTTEPSQDPLSTGSAEATSASTML